MPQASQKTVSRGDESVGGEVEEEEEEKEEEEEEEEEVGKKEPTAEGLEPSIFRSEVGRLIH